MKIAIYSGSIPSTTFIENLIEGVAKTHKVYLFGVKNNAVSYVNGSGNIKIFSTPQSNSLKFIITFFRVVLLVIKYPRRFKLAIAEMNDFKSKYSKLNYLSRIAPVLLHLPDVFHIQWAKDLEAWSFLKEKFGIKLVLSLRGAHINYSPLSDPILADSYRKNFLKVDAFHAVSKAIAFEAQKYNAEPKRIHVIHSPLPQPLFDKFDKNIVKNETIKILSVGRFHWKKGYRYALNAVKTLKDKGCSVNYSIIASDSISEEILFQRHQLQLEDCVDVISGLPQSELFNVMKTYDCMLLPSVEEGIANVVLEAMAIGLPVISTDCGGMSEVIIPEKTGWLVPVRDAKAITEAIIKFIEMPIDMILSISQEAHDFVKIHFNEQDSINAFLEMYEKVLSESH